MEERDRKEIEARGIKVHQLIEKLQEMDLDSYVEIRIDDPSDCSYTKVEIKVENVDGFVTIKGWVSSDDSDFVSLTPEVAEYRGQLLNEEEDEYE